jgi:hypothetical protein
VLAWIEDLGHNEEIYLRRWNGQAWGELAGSARDGGISRTPGPSSTPALALDGQDNPVVAWAEGRSVWLRRHGAGGWHELAGSAHAGGLSGEAGRVEWPSLVIDRSGLPVVAWCQGDRIFLRRYDGVAWRELGGSGSGEGVSGAAAGDCRPGLALDSLGHPWVAWVRYRGLRDGGGDMFLRRWDGQRWLDLAAPPAQGSTVRQARSVRLALTPAGAPGGPDRPVLAWREAESVVRRFWIMTTAWDGGGWVGLGSSARGRGLVSEGSSAYAPDLVLDDKGHPIVVWNALVGPWSEHDIYLKRWDGERWVGLGGSGADGGLSANRGDSGGPVVSLDAAGNPTVAWTETRPHNAEIFVRRFVPRTDE